VPQVPPSGAGREGRGPVEILFEVVAEAGGEVLVVEVMPDHVHLLVEVPPVVALPKLVQKLKGRSSRMLRAEFAYLRCLLVL